MMSSPRFQSPRFRSFAVVVAILAMPTTAMPQSRKQATPSRPPTPGARHAEARVISKATEDARRSSFLSPPGLDRYDPNEGDWRDVPPWRQTSFFGIRVRGQFFIYVVDCSGSMIDEDRLGRAKAEVRRSVLRLRDPQQFKVIFYNDLPIPVSGDLPNSADSRSKDQFLAWLRLIEPEGETDPRGAMNLAISMRPDAIFLLSDGEFPPETADLLAKKNTKRIPIHCVNLSSDGEGRQLKRIATTNGGQYVWRPSIGP